MVLVDLEFKALGVPILEAFTLGTPLQGGTLLLHIGPYYAEYTACS